MLQLCYRFSVKWLLVGVHGKGLCLCSMQPPNASIVMTSICSCCFLLVYVVMDLGHVMLCMVAASLNDPEHST